MPTSSSKGRRPGTLVLVALVVLVVILIIWILRRHDGPHNHHHHCPSPPSGYSVKLVNNSPVPLFFGAIGPSPVEPCEKTWTASPGGFITINIPEDWLSTAGDSTKNGPRFWARTGCAYDPDTGKTQCETGDCGGKYDCSAAGLAGVAPASLAEFCFKCGGGLTYYDVSLVDGYNLSIDIQPAGPQSAAHPGDPKDPMWCKSGLCNAGMDMRSVAPAAFQLKRSDLVSYVPGGDLSGDDVVASFSNCGKYEYPVAPSGSCSDSDPTCKGWRKYCCQADTYGKACKTDGDCTDGGACWNGTCQCRAYYSQGASCPANVCTNPGGQPPPAQCPAGTCIGDDVMHGVCPRAYTWPNDPQTYNCDAKQYIITFSPGGTKLPVAGPREIPKCSSLPPPPPSTTPAPRRTVPRQRAPSGARKQRPRATCGTATSTPRGATACCAGGSLAPLQQRHPLRLLPEAHPPRQEPGQACKRPVAVFFALLKPEGG